MVPCESTAEEVSFEWSHQGISSTDPEVRTTSMSPQLTLGVKGLMCSCVQTAAG